MPRSWLVSVTNALAGLRSGADNISQTVADDVLLIANSNNFGPKPRDALRAVTPGTRLSRQAAVKAGLAQGANSGELQKVLGVSQRVVDRLRSSSQLDLARTSGTINSHQVFEAEGLEQLRKHFQDRMSIGAIAERLDISRHGVEQLACLGLIAMDDQAPMRAAFVQRQAKESDYLRLLRDLNEAAGLTVAQDASPWQDAVGTITMHVAMKTIGGREYLGPVILAMLSGELPFQLDRSHDGRFMSRVRLAMANLPKLASLSFGDGALSYFSNRLSR